MDQENSPIAINDGCAYYQNNAQHYFHETLTLDLSENRHKFLSYLPLQAHILDLVDIKTTLRNNYCILS